MSKENIYRLAVLVLVLILVVGGFMMKRARAGEKYAVYLTTGEIYVGELKTFPRLELRNGYILSTVQDPQDSKKTNFQLNPLSDALWAPKHLYLNKKNVVFYVALSPESLIAKKLAEAEGKQ